MSKYSVSWYSLVKGLLTYVIVLFVILGLDFGSLTIFFENLNFDLYLFSYVYIKHFQS